MFRIVLLNLGCIASLTITVFLPGLIPIPTLSFTVFTIGFFWCCTYLSACALSVKTLSNYQTFSFTDFQANLKTGWLAGIAAGFAGLFLFVITRIIIPFYLNMESTIWLLPAAVIFWTLALAVASFQFFFSIRARLDTTIWNTAKKCLVIFFDNPGFAVFCLLLTLVTFILSAFLVFLLPGPAGILLFLDEALRLRLLKYDWQTRNPPLNSATKRRTVPWDIILNEEKEKTGTRSLRSFIFPWKD